MMENNIGTWFESKKLNIKIKIPWSSSVISNANKLKLKREFKMFK